MVAASSANHHGEPDPRTIEQIPEDIRAAVGAVIDIGELPGIPSTVVDVSWTVPRVLREGSGDPKRVLDALGYGEPLATIGFYLSARRSAMQITAPAFRGRERPSSAESGVPRSGAARSGAR